MLGSWQNKSLKTTDPGKTYAVTINLSDFTAESYKLYYGTDKGLDSRGLFSIPISPTAQNRALMIAAVDGAKCVAWHYPKTSIIGADSVTMDPAARKRHPRVRPGRRSSVSGLILLVR
ncbi:hypothetical protein [Kitasatospora sp. NPDC058046]|uniref:phage tail tube protein n=1 Tax=Kitasatospora sp. NPDC058046 TaxID=3346312 RepID=UPI0036D7DF9F